MPFGEWRACFRDLKSPLSISEHGKSVALLGPERSNTPCGPTLHGFAPRRQVWRPPSASTPARPRSPERLWKQEPIGSTTSPEENSTHRCSRWHLGLRAAPCKSTAKSNNDGFLIANDRREFAENHQLPCRIRDQAQAPKQIHPTCQLSHVRDE